MYATAVAQAAGYYNITFLMVALPFLVEEISADLDPGYRLVWAGLLVGATPLALTAATMLWSTMAKRYSPKILLARAFAVQAVTTILIATTSNLYLIFALRLAQGLLGEAATVALIIVSVSSRPERRASNIGLFQGIAMMSMALAPSLGAFFYTSFGYRVALLLGAGSAVFAVFLVLFTVSDVRRPESMVKEGGRAPSRGWFIVAFVFVALASAQHMSVVPLFPTILRGFEISGASAVTYAGWIASLSAIGSAVAMIGLGRLADQVGGVRLVVAASFLAAVSLALMGVAKTVETFLLLRVIQASMISATFVPIIARASTSGKWRHLGGIQAARYLGAGIGTPIVAILVVSLGLPLVFTTLSLISIMLVVTYAMKSHDQIAQTRRRV